MTIRSEILLALGLRPVEGEDDVTLAKRVADKANGMPETAWVKLSNDAQTFVNANVDLIGEGKPPKALPEADAEDEAALAGAKKAKVASAKKAPKAPKAPKAGDRSSFGDSDVIAILITPNPHRPSSLSYDAYDKLKDGGTVGAVVQAGVPRAYLRNWQERGTIAVNPAGSAAATAAAKQPKAAKKGSDEPKAAPAKGKAAEKAAAPAAAKGKAAAKAPAKASKKAA